MDHISFSAWLFIGAVIVRWAYAVWKDRHTQRERLAVRIEYDDLETTDKRRNLLQLRFPQYLIDAPDSRFYREAREQIRSVPMSRDERLEMIRDVWWVIAFWSVTGILLFIGFAGLVKTFDPPPYGSVWQQASFLALGFLQSHPSAIAWIPILLYLSYRVRVSLR